MAKNEDLRNPRSVPQVVELSPFEAANLIATLVAQLGKTRLENHCTGATFSVYTMEGKHVVMYVKHEDR